MADNDKKKKSGFAVAFFLLVAIVLFIIFLVKKDDIVNNLKETNFFGRVVGSNPEFIENYVPTEKPEEKIPLEKEAEDTIVIQIQEKPAATEEPAKKETEKTDEQPKTEQKEEKTPEKKPETPKKETKVTTTEVAYTNLQLCFVEIDSEGSVNRKLIKRSIPKNDSPLTTAIKLLLEGPDTTKPAEKDCMSLIPSGVSLLGAKVSGGVAYLDFSEKFEINANGVEGYQAQLMQVVYTATTFSTVNSVQILIEGKKQEYLGPEGIWIGSPLSRNSF